MPMNKKLVLLDTHAILHRAYHALPDFSSSKGEPTGAIYGLCAMLFKIISDVKPDYLVACYDLPGKTYRHEAYDAYKAGRKKVDDNLVIQMKRSRDVFAVFGIPIYQKEGFEADDMLGTIVEQVKNIKDLDVIIASGDMDTLQLVSGNRVQVYTLKKGIKDTILYDEDGVKSRYGFSPLQLPDYKGLRGDPSDNIIGIKGIGEVTATSLIAEFGTIEGIYEALKKGEMKRFEKAGIKERIINLLTEGEEEARFSKMLATIRRDAPITFEVPDKSWKDLVDVEKTTALFSELEFRTLGARLKSLLGQGGDVFGDEEEKESKPRAEENISAEDIRQTGIALWVQNSNITNPTLDDILAYTKKETFAEAKAKIFEDLVNGKGKEIYETIEKPLIPIVEKMERFGIKIDKAYLKKLSDDYHKELASFERKIWKMAGKEFNISSPKQLGAVLFDDLHLEAKGLKKTAGGARSTKESELEKLKDEHEIIALILEYRELAKLLSTYIDPIPTQLDAQDRLHAKFIQAGTTTGRMSSQEPNMQNIPIRDGRGRRIRNAFIAEKGWVLGSFDYSQIELRIAAFLSGDEKLIEIFKNGEDVHTAVAAKVFRVPLGSVDKEMRRKAKVINFGILYGMGVNALRVNLGTDRKEAQQFYNDYFATFSRLATYLEEVKRFANQTGYTETFFGRKRYFDGIKSKVPFIRAAAERMAINAPIQGTEADIVKIAMVEIDRKMDEMGLGEKVRPLLQVHDELVYEIEEGVVDEVVKKVRGIMEAILPKEKTSGVPILSSANIGPNWGEMKEF